MQPLRELTYNSYKTKDTFSHLQIHKNTSKCNPCKQDLINNFFFFLNLITSRLLEELKLSFFTFYPVCFKED